MIFIMISQLNCIIKRKNTGIHDFHLYFSDFMCIISLELRQVIKLKYEIGKRIRKYREACGISQKQLAEKLGISNNRVSNWEQGINRPDADILADICRALNISPSELLNVRLSSDELNEKEKDVIKAYRSKPELQQAVDILLGIAGKNK